MSIESHPHGGAYHSAYRGGLGLPHDDGTADIRFLDSTGQLAAHRRSGAIAQDTRLIDNDMVMAELQAKGGRTAPNSHWSSPIDFRLRSLVSREQRIPTVYDQSYDPEAWGIQWWLYDNVAIYAAVIEGTLDAMFQGDEDGQKYRIGGPKSKITDEIFTTTKSHGIDAKLEPVGRSLLNNGNALLKMSNETEEITEPILTSTHSWFDIQRSPEGRFYVQGRAGAGVFDVGASRLQSLLSSISPETQQDKANFAGTNTYPARRVIHHRLGFRAGLKWGRAPIMRALREVQAIANAHADIGIILKKFAAPTRDIEIDLEKLEKLGLPVDFETPEGREEMQRVMDSWSVTDSFGHPDFAKMTVIPPHIPTTTALYDKLEGIILGLFRYPRHLMHNVANRSVSDNIEKSFQQRINTILTTMADVYNRSYIWPMAMQLGLSPAEAMMYRFEFLRHTESRKEFEEKTRGMANLVKAEILTPSQAAQMYLGIDPASTEKWRKFENGEIPASDFDSADPESVSDQLPGEPDDPAPVGQEDEQDLGNTRTGTEVGDPHFELDPLSRRISKIEARDADIRDVTDPDPLEAPGA